MSNSVDRPPQRIMLGVVLIVATSLTISIQDLVFKFFSSEMTLWQIFILRGMLALPLIIAACRVRGSHRATLRTAFRYWILLRSLFITCTFLAFYAALPFLSMSTVGAANYIAPVFVSLLSVYVIGEALGLLGWAGIFLGFAGVLVLLQPGTDAFSPWALLPVIGAVFYSLAHIITRAKCQNVSVAAISLAQNFVMLLAGGIASLVLHAAQLQGELPGAYPYLFDTWSSVALDDWLVLAVLAAFAVCIGMMLAGAYQVAPPPVVATFEYSYLLFVAAWDVLFFGVVPSGASVAGTIMIVAAGLLVIHSSRYQQVRNSRRT